MVAAAMRTRFDQFGKQMVRDALEGRCSVEPDAEVPADTRRIDLWVTPCETGASLPDHLGFLGRITSSAVTLALPVLLRLRLVVPTDPAQQTSDDQEFLMNTQDIVEAWRREAVQEGLEQGVERERKLLLRLLRRRFGAEVDGETERRVAAAPAEQVEVWAERVLSAGTLAELLAD